MYTYGMIARYGNLFFNIPILFIAYCYKSKSSFRGKATAKDSLQDYVVPVSLTSFHHKIYIFNSRPEPLSLTFFLSLFFPPKRT